MRGRNEIFIYIKFSNILSDYIAHNFLNKAQRVRNLEPQIYGNRSNTHVRVLLV